MQNKTILLLWVIAPIYLRCSHENPSKEYYSNGQLKSKTYLFDGKRHGIEVLFFKDGDTISITNWEHGFKSGQAIHFLEGSHSKRYLTYVDGVEDGSFYSIDTKLQTFDVGKYSNGKLNGLYQYFDSDSILLEYGFYEEGRLNYGKVLDSIGNPISSYYSFCVTKLGEACFKIETPVFPIDSTYFTFVKGLKYVDDYITAISERGTKFSENRIEVCFDSLESMDPSGVVIEYGVSCGCEVGRFPIENLLGQINH